jgi:DNA replication protein DnaC
MELATGHFIRERTDVLFLGPPGVGKTHLVSAIGHQAAKIGFAVLYRSIFDTIQEFIAASLQTSQTFFKEPVLQ